MESLRFFSSQIRNKTLLLQTEYMRQQSHVTEIHVEFQTDSTTELKKIFDSLTVTFHFSRMIGIKMTVFFNLSINYAK